MRSDGCNGGVTAVGSSRAAPIFANIRDSGYIVSQFSFQFWKNFFEKILKKGLTNEKKSNIIYLGSNQWLLSR